MHPLLFADRARKIMQLASQEAFQHNHEFVGTEQILLGLLEEGSGVTPSMLNKIDRDFGTVRRELAKYLEGRRNVLTACTGPYSPAAKSALDYADEEARNSGHPCVEAEHILVGLVREPQGIVGQVLRGFGLKADELRPEIEGVLRQPYRIAEATAFRR
jgi:ATP-dependent Clp protease ATP-binding subunit ClpC